MRPRSVVFDGSPLSDPHITERHLKITDSYISAPQIHAKAVRTPTMLGGPFIDYGGQRVDEIRALRDGTRLESAEIIELRRARR